MYVNQRHRDWDEWLPYAVFAYISAIQDTTGYSPHYLLYGFEPRLFMDMEPNQDDTVAEHYEKLHDARVAAIQATRKAQGRQKAQYDRRRYEQSFNEGDLVWVHRARGYIGQTTKLRSPYEGPWRVMKKYDDLNYWLRDESGSTKVPKEDLVHISRLKPYYERPPELREECNIVAKKSDS